MSQSRISDDDSGKMAISYANSLPTDHSQTLPSFREVSSILLVLDLNRMATDEYSFFPLTSMMKSNLPPTLPLTVITNPPPSSPVVSNNNTLLRLPK